MRRFETREPREPRLGLGAPPGRPLVADLPARAGGRTRIGRDGCRVVVRLHLHQDVDRLAWRSRIRRSSGFENKRAATCPSITAALSLVGREHPAGACLGALLDDARTATFRCRSPSMIHSALKILWRQCSLLACANIMSSTSVGCAPEGGEGST